MQTGIEIKSPLTERIISALWFLLLGCLLIPGIKNEYYLSHTLQGYALLCGFIFACIGFFYGYKTLLLPADNTGSFMARWAGAAWASALGLLVFLILALIFPNINDKVPLLNIALTIVGFLWGFFYGYKFLLWPKIDYTDAFPTMTERVIATVWFGVVGYAVLHSYGQGIKDALGFFIMVFSAYLGFAYGWRILVLPFSGRAILKAIVLGLTGSSCLLLLFLLVRVHIGNVVSHDMMMNVDAYTLGLMFLFLVLGLFVCGTVIGFTLMLYFAVRRVRAMMG